MCCYSCNIQCEFITDPLRSTYLGCLQYKSFKRLLLSQGGVMSHFSLLTRQSLPNQCSGSMPASQTYFFCIKLLHKKVELAYNNCLELSYWNYINNRLINSQQIFSWKYILLFLNILMDCVTDFDFVGRWNLQMNLLEQDMLRYSVNILKACYEVCISKGGVRWEESLLFFFSNGK